MIGALRIHMDGAGGGPGKSSTHGTVLTPGGFFDAVDVLLDYPTPAVDVLMNEHIPLRGIHLGDGQVVIVWFWGDGSTDLECWMKLALFLG